MSETVEVVLTSLANVTGYLLLFGLAVAVIRALDRRQIGVIPSAALALTATFAVAVFWYVATMYWLGSYPHGQEPEWLESTSGMAENIQSEVIQIWIAALVFKHLLWLGTPESKSE